MEIILMLLTMLLLSYGLWRICAAALYHDRSTVGRQGLRQIQKARKEKQDLWDSPICKSLSDLLCRIVFLDDTAKESLTRQLQRAGMHITPEEFTARKYVIYAACAVGLVLCAAAQFWLGVILCGLLAAYGVMRQREVLTSKIKARDEAIGMEMPRFVRAICRTLRQNRDIPAALYSYRKVAGSVLGAELDILLAHMRTGSVPVALQQFQKRIGTESAFRLCATLQEIERGIDQTATLEHLAEDMAQQSRLNIQKALSVRPGQMRATYLPAVGVCVVMIIYVLVVFIINQLNNLY